MLFPEIYPTAELQKLDEIRIWHGRVVESLSDQRATVQKAIQDGSSVAPRYMLMEEAEVGAEFDDLQRELDRLTMLNLVASAEASIKLDYLSRIQSKKPKDALTTAYLKWHKALSPRKQRRPDFDRHGILEVLKSSGVMHKHIIGKFRRCLLARHWIGHGRCWDNPDDVNELDPIEVYGRAKALLQALPM